MSGPAPHAQWYLARDGQQFGPISDAEMAKFVELGHLQPTDLLWREGFPDWRPAMVVFPPRGRGQNVGQPLGQSAGQPQYDGPRLTRPQSHAGHSSGLAEGDLGLSAPGDRPGYGMAGDERPPRRRGRALALLVLALALVGGAGAAYHYRVRLTGLIASATATLGATAKTDAAMGAATDADRKSLETPPLAGFRADNPAAIDATLQGTALWKVIKREFPDWYGKRLEEAVALSKEGKDDATIAQFIAGKVAELRREQAVNGLSANIDKLKVVAATYLESLSRLRAYNADACAGFIKQGEAEPLIVALLRGSAHTAHLQAGLTAIFEAIADGRQLPRVQPRPSQEEYQALAAALFKKGWTQADMVLFNDPREFAKASPEKACQLVDDFFSAQLTFENPETRMRFIGSTLGPVFKG